MPFGKSSLLADQRPFPPYFPCLNQTEYWTDLEEVEKNAKYKITKTGALLKEIVNEFYYQNNIQGEVNVIVSCDGAVS